MFCQQLCTRGNHHFLYTSIAHLRKSTNNNNLHTAQLLSTTWKLHSSVVFRCLLYSTGKSCKWHTKWGVIR